MPRVWLVLLPGLRWRHVAADSSLGQTRWVAMLILDLRWLLFGVLVLLVAAVAGTAAVMDWRNRRNLLLRTLAQMQPVFEATPAGVLAFTDQNRLHYANAAARQLLALPAEADALPPNLWADLQVQETWEDSLPSDQSASDQITNEQSAALPLTWRKLRFHPSESDRALVLSWWIAPLPGLIVAVVTDGTAQQNAAQEMRLLLGGLSHELRTPLATIATHVEVLRIPALPAEARAQSLQFIADEIQRLVRLVANVMELGRLENGVEQDIQPVNLAHLAEEVIIQLSDAAQTAGADLTLAAQAPGQMVLGQPDRLKQVFLNLLDNAIKYGQPGNQITVALAPAPTGVRCTITDTGPGIAPEHLPLLGRQYYRAAPASIPGNGLGLAIVQAILRQHGSRLEITSQSAANAGESTAATGKGRQPGTSVSFTIPSSGRDGGL